MSDLTTFDSVAITRIKELEAESMAKDARIAELTKALENVVTEYCERDGVEDVPATEQSIIINTAMKALNYDS